MYGILDGTHITVKSSSDDTEAYINRKNYTSINNLIMIDAEEYVIWVDAGKFWFFLSAITNCHRL